MIDLNKVKNCYLYTSKVDMRFGIFAVQKRLALSFTPIEILGSIFIFVSRDRKQVKIYYEDEYGSWLFINKMKFKNTKKYDKYRTFSLFPFLKMV